MNNSDYYERVSLRLTEVLDASGLKDDLRWRRINTWLQTEELEKIWYAIADPDARLYYFGSQTEATTTPGLSSDIDKVVFIHHYVVLKDLQFWQPRLETETTFLMVADENTPPGYVKLQLVQRYAPLPVYNYQCGYVFLDSEGRSVLSNRCFPEVSGNLLGNLFVQFDQHGPAVTTLRTGMSVDLVYAIPSRCWPDQGFRWMSKSRKYNWPTRPMMDAIMKTVVFFVPVGLRLSPEQHLEWRLSFSFAEKLLMMQFNSTQYKCYVMLKLIKNTFLNVDTVETVLTSYHCKTCMFYLIENTQASLWHPRNLMLCIDVCLRQLLTWIQCANCPNYFVPDENMFLGKLVGPAQTKIANILQDLLNQNGKYITKIRYENIGENVARAYPSLGMDLRCPDENILLQTIGHLENILHFFCLYSVIFHLSNVSVLKSRYGPRREIGNIVRLIFCSVLGNHLASQSLQQEMYNHENLIAAQKLLRWGSSSDVAAGNLKLAAFYLALGKLDRMEDVLQHVDANFTEIVFEQGDKVILLITLSKILNENLSAEQFIQTCVALMVCYSPSDIHIIPKVLIFEIFRSTGSELSVDMTPSVALNVVAVKARIYLYFLQYQCFLRQGRVADRLAALSKMLLVLKDYYHKLFDTIESMTINLQRLYLRTLMSESLGFVTTSLNLMSYCLKQDGRPIDAFKVLCLSMKLKNQHNAAKWQISVCISSSMRNLSDRQ